MNPIKFEVAPTHVSSDVAKACINSWFNTGRMISDDVAATIASWWQSPGSIGVAFTKVSQGTEVDFEEVIEACYTEFNGRFPLSDDRLALLCLAAWAWTRSPYLTD